MTKDSQLAANIGDGLHPGSIADANDEAQCGNSKCRAN